MKTSTFLILLSLFSGPMVSAAAAGADASSHSRDAVSLSERDPGAHQDLWKRKGGGRGGGGGVGGGGGGSRTSPSSNMGGATRAGSGPPPPYRGGTYGGGSKIPQKAGNPSTIGRIAPFLLVGGLVAFWPGVWLYGAYMYPYHHPWHYYNRTSNRNETLPVLCGCSRFEVCSCDDNNNQTFIDDIIGNGSAATLNQRGINVADVNGTRTLLINGTLPNGTTAPGGDDDDDSAAAGQLPRTIGYWPVVATVCAAVLML